MWHIKKKGLYLSSRNVVYQHDYWEPSEIETQFMTRYTWMKDHAHAMTFIDRVSAQGYLARNHGKFWRDAEVFEE